MMRTSRHDAYTYSEHGRAAALSYPLLSPDAAGYPVNTSLTRSSASLRSAAARVLASLPAAPRIAPYPRIRSRL